MILNTPGPTYPTRLKFACNRIGILSRINVNPYSKTDTLTVHNELLSDWINGKSGER